MPERARCAAHPDVPAADTCARCGDYYCRGCADPRHDAVCIRCGDRLPSGIAGEDPRHGVWPWRWLKTLWHVIWKPKVAFPGPARFVPALGFAAICGALIGVMLLVMGAALLAPADSVLRQQLGGEPKSVLWLGAALAVLLPMAASVVWSGLLAVSFAVGLASVGRTRGVMRFALRACGYAQAITLLAVLLPFGFALSAQLVADSRLLFRLAHASWIVSSLAWPLLSGRVCFHAGRGVGLDSGRAALAALGATLACVPVAAWVTEQQLDLLAHPLTFGP